MKLDVLAIGAHPDDVELGCAGLLLSEKKLGKKTGIIDLTRGELGTRGTIETRKKEADAASAILQLDARENLGMSDGFFQNDEQHQRKLITAIRKYQPEIIICTAPEDRHPDHGRSSRLIEDAAFLSGLRKIETTENGKEQEIWRPKYVFHFIQDRYLTPNFVYDITPFFAKKIEAIKAFKTQFFDENSNEPETYISKPGFLETIEHRARMFGQMIGVDYAEGFISEKMIGISSLNALTQKIT
ncbi:MAG TPA: bacillithiol biosynthesis deacetylase BshB1 [Ferruginibacter sp.]|nr:bacillithiol biosynthesis deacetylase BshB1 [Bacteroidota bacterium]MCC6692416.1 bacillithiol biosynthesis deacetylase BshB1 [Chitinophagaceae bacterium]HMT96350.1 bacillithiol biosynthesis deacetylase BshB1 [Ferruginibacter sp.]MBS1924616.1 bacillithiol biosynthesis deacetylase BshB1 [Bacteroidota bacterium]HMU24256.1 bacillithiol biosynthesis deacetylase BshB1 [Ferruginibacter sp.]